MRLEWNPSGRATSFYRRVRSTDTSLVWSRPSPPARVLELDEIRLRLDAFSKKVEMLVSQFPDEAV